MEARRLVVKRRAVTGAKKRTREKRQAKITDTDAHTAKPAMKNRAFPSQLSWRKEGMTNVGRVGEKVGKAWERKSSPSRNHPRRPSIWSRRKEGRREEGREMVFPTFFQHFL